MARLRLHPPTNPDQPPMPPARTLVDGDVVKFCLATADGYETESVIVPMGAAANTWKTLCVSSQIGCRRGCSFCHTARMGLVRNLSVDEILNQVGAARLHFNAMIRNVVFMGMGEPMDNLDNVIVAVTEWHNDHRQQIPRRRVTISTVGRCDGIRRLAALRWRRLNLAVSLNAPNDDIRSRIMPINRVEPMADLRRAIAEYPVRAGGHVLIEYVLIKGLNDAAEHAAQLAEYLRGLHTCVNLIPYNSVAGPSFQPPADDVIERFQLQLMKRGQLAFRRNTKGRLAMAACGQLGDLAVRSRFLGGARA